MHPIIQNGSTNTPKSLILKQNKNQNYIDLFNSNTEINSNQNNFIGDDELSLLRLRILIQKNIMKEYQIWINKLLIIIGERKDDNIHFDIGTPIQEGLQRIEDMFKDNYKIKQKLIKEISKNENLTKKIEEKKKENKVIKQEYSKDNLDNIIYEKNKLLNNIQVFANEVDDLGEKKRQFEDYIKSNLEIKELSELYNQYINIKEENQDIKKILEIQNRKNCLNYGNKKMVQNIINNPRIMKNLGKFALEEEENFKDLGFFGCGISK